MERRRSYGPSKGPYRESIDEEDLALKEQDVRDTEKLRKIKRDISSEEKISFDLPEHMRDGDVLKEFTTLEQFGFKSKNYEDVVLLSADLGILRFIDSSEHPFSKTKTLLHWQNEEKTADVTLCVDKNKKEVTLFAISENPHPGKNK